MNALNPGTPEHVRRKRGRPPTPLDKQLRGRVSVGFNETMHEQLQQAARDNARSVSAELADRVARSFAQRPEARLIEWIEQTAPPPPAVRARFWKLLEALPDEGDRQVVALYVTSPLGRAIQVGGLNILGRGVLARLASELGCSHWQAFEWWTDLLKLILPYVAEPYVETTALQSEAEAAENSLAPS
jgi:hypothetical protein